MLIIIVIFEYRNIAFIQQPVQFRFAQTFEHECTQIWYAFAPGLQLPFCCNCAETLKLIEEGRIDTTPLITHTYALKDIEEAYRVFENRLDGVIKIAIKTEA